ncbi:MAG: transcriptional regulator GcvA [Alphaproteobacteria bacterium]|jgi:LysR family glycine cleavage system transcriptional activator|nr:transcriptional regulator GcvA [Alphaproteobacteria bacterium]
MAKPVRRLPPLNALRAFDAAARHQSFKDAATELGLTHGAVSYQIRQLEDWLGPPELFARGNRRVTLTPAGRAFHGEVAAALSRIASAAGRHAEEGARSRRRILKVNALATFALRWLLPRLGDFRRSHPAVDVRLSTSSEPVDSLAELHDVVIRRGPDSFHGYVAEPFLTEHRLPVCSPTALRRHRLRRPGDLANHTLLHAATQPRLWPDWLALAGLRDVEPAGELVLDHNYLALQAAIDGLGIAIGPTALVASDLAAGRLVAPFSSPVLPSRSYCAYVPEGAGTDPAIRDFCAWLRRIGAADKGG